jgi:NADPH:quinone reductase
MGPKSMNDNVTGTTGDAHRDHRLDRRPKPSSLPAESSLSRVSPPSTSIAPRVSRSSRRTGKLWIEMQAYVLEAFDSAASLGDAKLPMIGTGDVLVRVEATSVNPFDAVTRRGGLREMFPYQLPATLGRDVAGVVTEVGRDVTTFTPGDEVFGLVKRTYIGDGTFAAYVAVPEDEFIVLRPPTVDVVSAGACGTAGVAALQCVNATGLAAGDRVFIHGATGGVGAFAIQLAAKRGAEVIATAEDGEEAAFVTSLGAVDAVAWRNGDAAELASKRHPALFDVCIDLVSRTPESFSAVSDTVLKPGGRAATTNGVAGRVTLERDRSAANVNCVGDPKLLREFGGLLETGEVTTPVAATLPFGQLEEAYETLAAGVLGKVAVLGPERD